MKKFIKIATRKSPLALWQANHIKSQLNILHPTWQIELIPLLTQGDKDLGSMKTQWEGKSLFVKELQEALLNHTADIAVHSIKDMSVHNCPGLILAAISKREDPRDVFVSSRYKNLSELPLNAVVGTSS